MKNSNRTCGGGEGTSFSVAVTVSKRGKGGGTTCPNVSFVTVKP